MLRALILSINSVARNQIRSNLVISNVAVSSSRLMSSKSAESDEVFDARYEAYFNRTDIDGWELRKGMNDLYAMDLVPEPKIIVSALKACRRINDYALAIRYIEALKNKCGNRVSEIYPYLIQEIRPTLTELGISTPEEMGYDKPELHLQDVGDIH